MVRAKFHCHNKDNNTVFLDPVYQGSEENKKFWEYTPAGQITLTTTNKSALDQFEVGKEYYVDFTPAE